MCKDCKTSQYGYNFKVIYKSVLHIMFRNVLNMTNRSTNCE